MRGRGEALWGRNELGFQARRAAEDLQNNYPRIRGSERGTLLKTVHTQAETHVCAPLLYKLHTGLIHWPNLSGIETNLKNTYTRTHSTVLLKKNI